MMRPTLISQHRNVPLIVVSGLDGYRLAFVGGADFETVGTFSTAQAAHAAGRLAIDQTARMLTKAGAKP